MTQRPESATRRVMHEIKRRQLEVLRVTHLTPRMRRITLGGPQLAGFLSMAPDDHIKLMFLRTAEEAAALPTLVLGQATDGPKPAMRDYTPRRIDLAAGELDIDFVIHGDGPASTWAEQAKPGDTLYIGGPRGSLIVDDVFDSYLLIGDETALPAIARRLEELPDTRQVLAVIEVDNEQERQPLPARPGLEVIWVLRHQQSLETVVAGLALPPGELYGWIATEAALSRRLRRLLLDHFQLGEHNLKAAGYWRREDDADEPADNPR
jgi:NADPH-dependent ferric siderophore reductase